MENLSMSGLSENVFLEKDFFLLIVFSIVLPVVIYRILWLKQSISSVAVLLFGIALVVLAGIDVFLLRILADLAKHTLSLADDAIFNSELSVVLYLLPAIYAGTGINVVSHVLVHHLAQAEKNSTGNIINLPGKHADFNDNVPKSQGSHDHDAAYVLL
jgi:hypothetical protein